MSLWRGTLFVMAAAMISTALARHVQRTLRAARNVIGSPRYFAHITFKADHVLATSPGGEAVAYSGVRPVLPGHVIVAPTRRVKVLEQLSAREMGALFRLVRTVQRQVGEDMGATAFNLAIKDGNAAGQPVPHLHVHVVPRTPGDLAANDEVYERIDRWAPDGPPNNPPPLQM